MRLYIGDPTTDELTEMGEVKDVNLAPSDRIALACGERIKEAFPSLSVSVEITSVDAYALLLIAAVAYAWEYSS